MGRKKKSDALARERDEAVEEALFRRACGLVYEEVKITEGADKKTGQPETQTVTVRKYLPPDPTCAMFWLCNRQGGRWQYKPEKTADEAQGDTGVVLMPEVLP